MKKLVTLLQGVQTKKEKKKRSMKSKNERNISKATNYKDKGNKSCYMAKDSTSSDEDEMVYFAIRD